MSSVKDVFLCHAQKDKADFVQPLAEELDRHGISFWLDEAEIKWGARLSHTINEGLRKSRFVIVFLSSTFIGRNWPETELSSALTRENSEGRIVVLPVVVGDASTILEPYPLLKDKAYLKWDSGIPNLVDHLQSLLNTFATASTLTLPVRGTEHTVEVNTEMLLGLLAELDSHTHASMEHYVARDKLRECGFLVDAAPERGITINGHFVTNMDPEWGLPGISPIDIARVVHWLVTGVKIYEAFGRGSTYRKYAREIKSAIRGEEIQKISDLAAPRNLRVWRTTDASVFLYWEPIEGARWYTVLGGQTGAVETMRPLGTTHLHKFPVEDLQHDTEHWFSVKSHGVAGESTPCSPVARSEGAKSEEEHWENPGRIRDPLSRRRGWSPEQSKESK